MLLLPPYFYRDASAEGIEDAFAAILDDVADRSAARHALSYSADVGRRRAGVGGGQPSRAFRRDRRGSLQLRAVLSVIGDLPFTPALKAILAAQTGDAGWLRVRAAARDIRRRRAHGKTGFVVAGGCRLSEAAASCRKPTQNSVRVRALL
jgi:hypothetical protein